MNILYFKTIVSATLVIVLLIEFIRLMSHENKRLFKH